MNVDEEAVERELAASLIGLWCAILTSLIVGWFA